MQRRSLADVPVGSPARSTPTAPACKNKMRVAARPPDPPASQQRLRRRMSLVVPPGLAPLPSAAPGAHIAAINPAGEGPEPHAIDSRHSGQCAVREPIQRHNTTEWRCSQGPGLSTERLRGLHWPVPSKAAGPCHWPIPPRRRLITSASVPRPKAMRALSAGSGTGAVGVVNVSE